jgi:TPR repeat protein
MRVLRTLLLGLAVPLLAHATAPVNPDELLSAAKKGDTTAIEALIKRGADLRGHFRGGQSILAWPAYHGDVAMLRLLLDAGADVNKADPDGATALMTAVREGQGDATVLLLDKGADPNATDRRGLTALDYAANAGFPAVADTLRDRGPARNRPRCIPRDHGPGAVRDPAQAWMLACPALLDQINGAPCLRLGGEYQGRLLDGAADLAHWWGIETRDEALVRLQRLSETPNARQFDQLRTQAHGWPLARLEAAAGVLAQEPDGLRKLELAWRRDAALGPQGILAWDLVRLLWLASHAYAAGYLSKDEAWAFMRPAACRLQAAFGSWKECQDSYLAGRDYWNGDPRLQARMVAIEAFLLDPANRGSLWNKIPWKQPLGCAKLAAPPSPPSRNESMLKRSTWSNVLTGLTLAFAAHAAAADGDYDYPIDYAHPDKYSNSQIQTAATQGDPWAELILGQRYRDGQGLPKDAAKAEGLFLKAAAKQQSGAEWDLGDLYLRGAGVPMDKSKGLKWMKAAARDGDAAAWVDVGDCYRDGAGVAQDFHAAWDAYEQASVRGNGFGDQRLGVLLAKGQGVPVDMAKAKARFEAGTHKDYHGWTYFNYGDALLNGTFGAPDPAQAKPWLEKALNAHVLIAALGLGRMAEQGQGMPKDPALALDYYRTAAASGYPYAEREFGQALREGRLGPPDYAEAALQLSAAAQAGDAPAAGILAAMLSQGQGVAKDPQAALRLEVQGMGAPGSWSWAGKPAVIARATGPVATDGSLAGFESAPKLIFDADHAGKHLVEATGPLGTFWASAQLMHDDKNLYLGLDVVQDGPPNNHQEGANALWDGDSAELFVCAKTELNSRSRAAKCYDDYQYMIAPSSKDGTPKVIGANHPSVASAAVQRTPRGYTLVATIPLKEMDGLDWKRGDLVRFELSVGKAGPDGRRLAKLCFAATDEAYDSPDRWGEAKIE